MNQISRVGTSSTGKHLHYSVGAIIMRDGKYLLIERALPPFGWAAVAGHVDAGEEPEKAIVREVLEEVGLEVVSCFPLFHEEIDLQACYQRVGVHEWVVFRCDVRGEVVPRAREVKSFGWFTPGEIVALELEPVWEHFFKQLLKF